MGCKLACVVAALALQVIAEARLMCPSDPNCVCGGTLAVELNCNIDGRTVEINLLPNTYINIKCINATSLDYSKLPICANHMNTFKSVSFKDCPLPSTSFKEVLSNIGVSKTMALIFQNAKNLSGYFDRKHFAGLENLTKLLLSVNGMTHLPDNLFMDINKLTWLNIRSNSINLSEELFKPLERLETLEISHNHLTNISSNLFSHLSFLRKLSLWQSNVTWFSKDFFTGVDVLEELDLSSNGLNELPSSIFKPLKKLKKLTLFSNKFSSLPQNLFKSNDELETVVILNNDVELRELPKNLFGSLSNLKQIYIQRCGLEKIPYDVFANSAQITNISLAYNEIRSLPESTFNDQINLLELDLSHNNLKSLEPKLFSSLVRLEKLDLCYNYLVKISGTTFSPLLSLLDLNMEHNKLKTVSSYLFSNNRQRMYVSLAYNQLSFENKVVQNNSWIVTRVSPFAHTYNLRLLNLSHNKFTHTFEDWWINGHDILDISYNSISYLWDNENSTDKFEYKRIFKKPLKEIWISHNTFQCRCMNNEFIDFLQDKMKTKVNDLADLDCPFWANGTCNVRIIMMVVIVLVFAIFLTILVILYIDLRKYLYSTLKKTFYNLANQNSNNNNKRGIVVQYSDKDEEFVFKEVLPGMRHHLDLQIHTNPVNSSDGKQNFATPVRAMCTTLVIFSPNYLTSNYSHVNIKKIRGEMLKAKNTIYLFVDIGPENSIYAFLKEQRDPKTTVLWCGQDFWNTFLATLAHGNHKERIFRVNKIVKITKMKLATSKVSRPPESANIYALDGLPHMQV
ncbi:protein toll-like [Pectinophora gossypiella]|nr:protein toll-like [Pectinophora gossypiella]XP_049870964.1 protein toll-like [Pectinophora gossypiella]